MKLLHPDSLPSPLRRLGNAALPPGPRARIAAGLQDLANSQYRLRRGYGGNRKALTALHDRHRGETCVIMGNGPSMRDFDLRRLAGVDVFSLNRGYLLWDRAGLSPRYLVVTNNLVVEQFATDLVRVGEVRFTPWEYADFFPGDGNRFLTMSWRRHFATDIRRGIWGGATVTFAAMQIAYFLGYRRVVLIGVDHSFAHDGEPNQLLVASADDVNHFDPAYFGPGTRWHAPDLAVSEIAYGLARSTFAADGREIVDSTEGGKLRMFPRIALADALAG